jgi:hypothetical protein
MGMKKMGMKKYEKFVRRAKSTLTYDPGWSEDNPTGSHADLRSGLVGGQPHRLVEGVASDQGRREVQRMRYLLAVLP